MIPTSSVSRSASRSVKSWSWAEGILLLDFLVLDSLNLSYLLLVSLLLGSVTLASLFLGSLLLGSPLLGSLLSPEEIRRPLQMTESTLAVPETLEAC